jgi:hypothetical protein
MRLPQISYLHKTDLMRCGKNPKTRGHQALARDFASNFTAAPAPARRSLGAMARAQLRRS